jgi:predicted signal transduction protein with EAL and GGDEF domain
MGISAVAEGVETRAQAAGLRMLGCHVGQGFYFSHPLRVEEFDELLARHFVRTTGPAGPVLIDKNANMPGVSAVSSVQPRPTIASTLPG